MNYDVGTSLVKGIEKKKEKSSDSLIPRFEKVVIAFLAAEDMTHHL